MTKKKLSQKDQDELVERIRAVPSATRLLMTLYDFIGRHDMFEDLLIHLRQQAVYNGEVLEENE